MGDWSGGGDDEGGSAPSPPPAVSNPDKGQDFWGLVPALRVLDPWASLAPYSFNSDPPPPAGGGGAPPPPPNPLDIMHIDVNLLSLRDGTNSLTNSVRPLVAEYEELRKYVHATYTSIFGQDAVVHGRDNYFGPDESSGSYSPPPDDSYADNPNRGVVFQSNADPGSVNEDTPSMKQQLLPGPLVKSSRDFADNINPAQEKALAYIANALELTGKFIAGLDTSGIAYSSADRKARFPDPPGDVV
jgi:hypothetical protein